MLMNCPKCGKKTALLDNVCEFCGCKTKICEECGNVVEVNEESCNYCGYEFLPEEKQREKEKCDNINKNKKKSSEVLLYIKKLLRREDIFLTISFFLGIVLLIVTYFILKNFGNWENKSFEEMINIKEEAKEVKMWAYICVSLALFCFGLMGIVPVFTTIIINSSIRSKFMFLGFDYKMYYKNIPVNENYRIYATYGRGRMDIQMLRNVMYMNSDRSKLMEKFSTILITIVTLIGGVLLFSIMSNNIESYLQSVVKGENDTFLSFGGVLGLIVFVLISYYWGIFDNMFFIKYRAPKWIKDYKSKS